MKIKNIKLTVKVKGLLITVDNLDIVGPDRSVGIWEPYLEGYRILNITTLQGKKLTPVTYASVENNFYENEERIIALEEAVFKELDKLQEKKYRAAYKRAKKLGFRGSYSDWASEYT